MKVHFIGVGGIGMSALAQLLLERGEAVSGSDSEDGPVLKKMRKMGAQITVGHAAAHLDHPDLVVYSSAVGPHNPELIAARNRGIPVISRGQMMARAVCGGRLVAVTGAHGKSTTTALTAQLLLEAGLDPTVLLGAEMEALHGNARLGRGRWTVVEADESDGSFLWLKPAVAVITNLDDEHLDYFRNRADIERAYTAFARRLIPGGVLIGCADDPWLSRVMAGISRRPLLTYGLSSRAMLRAADVVLEPGRSRYRFLRGRRLIGEVELTIPGRHNVQNSLAVLAVAEALKIPFAAAQAALRKYLGARRRFEIHGEPGGVLVVEDYGHHPAEIRATLEAARMWKRRLRCVFQPHRYSRTRYLMEPMAASFHLADEVILLPIYAASEDPVEGTGIEALRDAMRSAGQKRVRISSAKAVLRELKATSRKGDLILFLGAGSVGALAAEFVHAA